MQSEPDNHHQEPREPLGDMIGFVLVLMIMAVLWIAVIAGVPALAR